MLVDEQKKIKRIAAVVYVLVMIFIVGGSYLNQTRTEADKEESQTSSGML
jgi:hypothetical protein